MSMTRDATSVGEEMNDLMVTVGVFVWNRLAKYTISTHTTERFDLKSPYPIEAEDEKMTFPKMNTYHVICCILACALTPQAEAV
jgi:hypothetical protein